MRRVKVFGKGTCAVSAAMDHSLHIWNLTSGRAKFIIQDTHIKEQPSHHLHVDEGHMIVYSSSDTKVWPVFNSNHAEGTRTLEVTVPITKVVDIKASSVPASAISFATSLLGQCLAPGDSRTHLPDFWRGIRCMDVFCSVQPEAGDYDCV